MTKALLAMCLLLSMSAMAQTAPHTYELDWTNPNRSYPVCSSTVTTWCDLNIILQEKVGTATNTISSTLSPLATNYVFPTYPSVGSHTYSVMESFKDFQGVTQMTAADTATVVVPNANGTPPQPLNGLTGVAK